ncbi:hypothetical protein EV363DRAFT_1220227 [Boletus edulis]|nr:hypothetical protein EV363DRAFT_1220227 [Boletus edulis]
MFLLVCIIRRVLCCRHIEWSLDSLFWCFSCHVSTVTRVVVFWQLPIFIAAADLVMIARVYAMWNKCKRILGVLLFVYVPQVVFSFVFAGIQAYSHPHGPLSSIVNQVPGFSTCDHSLSTSSPVLYFYLLGLRAAISMMLLGLAAIQTLKQSVEMYQVTKQWKPNQYMQLLVKDGILYFVVNTIFNITTAIPTNTIPLLFILSLSYLSIIPLMPRFIISVREFHKRRGQWEGIDAGFGASLHLISSENAVVSVVAIADSDATVNQVMEGEADESEGIQLEMRGDNIHQA